MSEIIGKAFQPGDVVLMESPLVSSVKVNLRGIVCANCFVHRDYSIRKCSACKSLGYCDEKCQKEHWDYEHKHECGMMRALINSDQRTEVFPDLEPVPWTNELADWLNSQTLKLMVLKFVNKVLREKDENGPVSRNLREIMTSELFIPNNDQLEKDIQNNPSESRGGLIVGIAPLLLAAFPSANKDKLNKISQLFNLPLIYQRFRCNSKDIFSGQSILRTCGVGFYLRIAKTARSCDSNVFCSFNGKKLVARATEDIPNVNKLSELKTMLCRNQDGHWKPLEWRRIQYDVYNLKCECRFCSEEYNAEVLPLRCGNKFCKERIPSDTRALEPCRKCGTTLGAQALKIGKEIYVEHIGNMNQLWRFLVGELTSDNLASDPVIHPENMLRVCAVLKAFPGRSEDIWLEARSLIPFVRQYYPKSSGLSRFLTECYMAVCRNRCSSKKEKENAGDYLREAMQITCAMYGPEAKPRLQRE